MYLSFFKITIISMKFITYRCCEWIYSKDSKIFRYNLIKFYMCFYNLWRSFGQVDDQMKLLQHSWSDMLVLDHLHQRLHNNLPDETTLHNGQKFDLLCLGLLGVPSLADLFNDLSSKLQELKFDLSDYICMKFLMLLNHGTFSFFSKFLLHVNISLSDDIIINTLISFVPICRSSWIS